MPAVQHPVLNPLVIPRRDQEEIEALCTELAGRKPVQVVSPGGRRMRIPASLQRFLVNLLQDLHDGKSVTVIPAQQKLTTTQAGKLLGMSRQHFVNLLESGAIPFHMVGSHRRVYLSDLLRHKRARDRQRRKILDRMVQSEVEEGLYTLIPENVQPREGSRRSA